MAATSDILFIIICSNNKLLGGKPYALFDTTSGIVNHVDPELVSALLSSRKTVLQLLQGNPNAHLGGVPVSDLPLAKGLSVGPEFDSRVESPAGQYMMAIQRYEGRFYLGMGHDRLEKVTRTRHHILIISGLYGLLTPTEPIQSYSCHVYHHKQIPAVWRATDLLSELLTSYIRRHKISTVLDLTADDDYRRLIAWETVRHATNGKLLHAFSNMYTGANALQSYGRLLNQLLAERDKTLHKLKANDKIEVAGTAVTFVDHPDPPSSPATIRSNAKVQEEKDESSTGHKLDVRVTYSDRIGRMRRNYLKVMADILNLNPREDLDFMPRFCRVIEKYPRFSKCSIS